MINVVPAIIADRFGDVEESVALVRNYVSKVQLDVMNGSFTTDISWPYTDMYKFDDIVSGDLGLPFWDSIEYEIDLLVRTPEKEIDAWIKAGATSIIVHKRSTDQFDDIHTRLSEFDVEMGVAFLPSDEVEDDLVEKASFVQLMGNDKIGYHGVELDEKVYAKAKNIRDNFPDIDIAVDIGVNATTAPKLVASGVNKLVSGSYIFDSVDVELAIRQLGSRL